MNNQKQLLFQDNTSSHQIEVWDNVVHRWLTIDGIEQTRIDCKHSDILTSAIDYSFLACLLFIDSPKKILLGGLGGGSLARYLHCKLPELAGTAIENNPTIARLAKDYFQFPTKQWQITLDDIQNATRNDAQERYDLILIDIADNKLTPQWLSSEKMLSQLKHKLSSNGVLAMNLLVSDAQSFSYTLKKFREQFERKTLCLSIPQHQNIIVFAFNEHPPSNDDAELKFRVKEMTDFWGLDYSNLLQQLQKDNPKGSGIF